MGFFADIWYDKCNAWGEIVQGDWIGHRIIPIYDDNSALGVLTGSGNKIYHDCSDNSYKSQGTSGGIKNQTIVLSFTFDIIKKSNATKAVAAISTKNCLIVSCHVEAVFSFSSESS